MMKKIMIIVAGGSGARMGASIPKQFIELNGKPILMHTLERLYAINWLMEQILVLPQSELKTWAELCKKHNFDIPHSITEGGKTRFESVKNGLEKITDAELVGVHDGVRPFVSAQVINACFSSAEQDGAAVPVVAIVQSLRKMEGEKSKAIDRNDFCAVQTPQCFQTTILKKAFAQAERTDFSDDASVVEAAGHSITLVEGSTENIKLTTPTDLAWAKLMLKEF